MGKDEVLAAIDGAWRTLKSAIESMTATELSAARPGGGGSVGDVLTHISRSEATLTKVLLENGDLHDEADSLPAVGDRRVAELITELDETHRALCSALRDAADIAFTNGSSMRDSIDQATTFHYYEHSVEIRHLTEEIRKKAES